MADRTSAAVRLFVFVFAFLVISTKTATYQDTECDFRIADDCLVIGLAIPLSGTETIPGESTQLGVLLALEHLLDENRTLYIPKIKKRLQVVLKVEDTRSTVKGAEIAAKKIIDQYGSASSLLAIIGETGASRVSPQAQLCKEYEIPYINSGGAVTKIYVNNPWSFGILSPISKLAETLIRSHIYFQDTGNIPIPSNIILIWEDSAHGDEFRETIELLVSQNYERFRITYRSKFEYPNNFTSPSDFSELIKDIDLKSGLMNGDLLFIDAHRNDFILFHNELSSHRFFFHSITYGARGTDINDLLRLKFLSSAIGVYGVEWWSIGVQNEATSHFARELLNFQVQEWNNLFDSDVNLAKRQLGCSLKAPDVYSATSYEATRAVISAVANITEISKYAIRDELIQIHFADSLLPGGVLKFNADGQAFNEYVITQVVGVSDAGIPETSTVYPLSEIQSPPLVLTPWFGNHHVVCEYHHIKYFVSELDKSNNARTVFYYFESPSGVPCGQKNSYVSSNSENRDVSSQSFRRLEGQNKKLEFRELIDGDESKIEFMKVLEQARENCVCTNGVELPKTSTIPGNYTSSDSWAGILLLLIGSVCILICFSLVCIIANNYNAKVLVEGHLVYVLIICIGGVYCNVAVLFIAGENSSASCTHRLVHFVLSSLILTTPIILIAYEIFQEYCSSKNGLKYKSEKYDIGSLLVYLSNFIVVAALIVYITSTDMITDVSYDISGIPNEQVDFPMCTFIVSRTVYYIHLGYISVLLAISISLTYYSRNTEERYSEVSYIMIACNFLMFFILILILSLSLLSKDDQNTLNVLFGLFYGCSSCIICVIIMFPKLMYLFNFWKEKNVLRGYTSSAALAKSSIPSNLSARQSHHSSSFEENHDNDGKQATMRCMATKDICFASFSCLTFVIVALLMLTHDSNDDDDSKYNDIAFSAFEKYEENIVTHLNTTLHQFEDLAFIYKKNENYSFESFISFCSHIFDNSVMWVNYVIGVHSFGLELDTYLSNSSAYFNSIYKKLDTEWPLHTLNHEEIDYSVEELLVAQYNYPIDPDISNLVLQNDTMSLNYKVVKDGDYLGTMCSLSTSSSDNILTCSYLVASIPTTRMLNIGINLKSLVSEAARNLFSSNFAIYIFDVTTPRYQLIGGTVSSHNIIHDLASVTYSHVEDLMIDSRHAYKKRLLNINNIGRDWMIFFIVGFNDEYCPDDTDDFYKILAVIFLLCGLILGSTQYLYVISIRHEYKRIQNSMKKIEKDAQAAAYYKFIGYMCHSMRNPMHSIICLVDALKEEHHTSEVSSLVDTLYASCHSLSDLVQFSLTDDNVAETDEEIYLTNRPCMIADIIRDIHVQYSLLNGDVFDTHLEIYDDLEHLVLNIDAVRFRQVICSAVNRALKLIDHSGTIDLKLQAGLSVDGLPRIEVCVVDSGPGVIVDGKQYESIDVLKLHKIITRKYMNQKSSLDFNTLLAWRSLRRIASAMNAEIQLHDRMRYDNHPGSIFLFVLPFDVVASNSRQLPVFKIAGVSDINIHLANEKSEHGECFSPKVSFKSINDSDKIDKKKSQVVAPEENTCSKILAEYKNPQSHISTNNDESQLEIQRIIADNVVISNDDASAVEIEISEMKDITSNENNMVSKNPEQNGKSLQDIKIMFCEDDTVNHMMMKRSLKKLKCKSVVGFYDGYDGLQELHNCRENSKEFPDLLISDIIMKQMNGDELRKEMTKFEYKLPTIAVTGNCTNADVIYLNSVGFDTVLPKPCSSTTLEKEIRELLRLTD